MKKYRVRYLNNEIELVEGLCLQPDNCVCANNASDPKCYYTDEEAQKIVCEYYERQTYYVKRLSTEAFIKAFFKK